ncbi:MAG: hypothetical protein LBQ98_02885 [Nitrososphaerota archaeon]|jgi:hypothetical protein|nr:hypothetical protein [Nitrososphaerota archaeon]
MKGHFGEDWRGLYYSGEYPEQSGSEYTKISVPLSPQYSASLWLPSDSSVKVDFRVEALIGYFYRTIDFASQGRFDGEKSDWSSIKSVTIPEVNASVAFPSSSGLPSQHSPLESFLSVVDSGMFFVLVGVVVVVLVVIVLVLLGVIVFLHKQNDP